MRNLLSCVRIAFGTLALAGLLALAAPAAAQQTNTDGSVNPTASSVTEQQLLEMIMPAGVRSEKLVSDVLADAQ